MFMELALTADPALFDDFVGVLSLQGFEGFWEDGGTLRCYIDSQRWPDGGEGMLAALLDPIARTHGFRPPSIARSVVPERNWNKEWEESLTPVQATDRIVVTPSWHQARASAEHPGKIILVIDPKMSFGTGYHETTRLTLRLLEKHLRTGARMLDVGTGTGILAIASIKLGAASAVGVDNDGWAAANALENVRVNGVADRVRVVQGELASVPASGFDVIAANIQRNVIEELLPGMIGFLEPQGMLLLSGLLSQDEVPVREAIERRGGVIRQELAENEWLALAAAFGGTGR